MKYFLKGLVVRVISLFACLGMLVGEICAWENTALPQLPYSPGTIGAHETMFAAARRDSNEKPVPVPNDMHLFLLVGQSNMAGRGTVTAIDREPLPRAFKLNRDDVWVPATSPIHFDRNSAGIGLANGFIKEYLRNHPHAVVGLIPCAVGGSSIATWLPEGTDPVGTNFRRAVARAKIALKNGKLMGILWHQGCSDASRSKTAEVLEKYYPRCLAAVAAKLRSELMAEKVPFIIGEIGEFIGKDGKTVQRALLFNPVINKVPSLIPCCGCASAKGLTHRGDFLHFNSASAIELGKRYYTEFVKLNEIP